MNLHARELGDVIMWTIGNFEENVKRTQMFEFSQKVNTTVIKTRKPDYNMSLTLL